MKAIANAYESIFIAQSLAQFFNSRWDDYSTVAGTIDQQRLARFFNSHWHNSSTVPGTIVQQWLARFFNSDWHDSSTFTVKIFSFFYAGRILQQWCSLLKNRAMYQEYDTWSLEVFCGKRSSLKMSQNSRETLVPEKIPVNFAKSLRTLFLHNNSGQLFLKCGYCNNEAIDIDYICCIELDEMLYCFG